MHKFELEELKELNVEVYQFIQNNDLKRIKNGKYDICNGIYVNIETYNTYNRKERMFESYRKYIDLQYIISAIEKIITTDIDKLNVYLDYDEEKDIILFEDNVFAEDNILQEGKMLWIDTKTAHIPCISVEKSLFVKKAVFKIPIA